jgi:GT2 family glycosyltransferase/SAM-dependent methyltransferase
VLAARYRALGRPARRGETSKARQRRIREGFFENYCRGAGLDIGYGGDLLCDNCRPWDYEHGDAQLLRGLADESFDFVYSSHTLEHVGDAGETLRNWWRVLKPGGYLIVYVPHRDLYEKRNALPSNWSADHKRFFLIERDDAPDTVGIVPLVERNLPGYELIYAKPCADGHTITDPQMHSDGEYSIELVLKKGQASTGDTIMAEKKVDVSIGITTWNQRELLRACLGSIHRHPPALPFEVIVVDNASADGTAEMVRASFPQVRLVANKTNRGWTGGCNQVAQLSRGRYVVLLNEDTTIEEETFGALARAMDDSSPWVGIGAPRLVWPGGERQPSCRSFPDLWSLLLRGTFMGRAGGNAARLRRYLLEDIDLTSPSRVDWALGACLIVRRELFKSVGLMDERFAYHDDTDFCYRARRAGYDTVFFPRITVVHHYQRRSAHSWFTRARWRHIRGVLRLFRKHGLFMNRRAPSGCAQGAETFSPRHPKSEARDGQSRTAG